MGFASSIRQARQMVVHGHFLVNGKKVDIPSYLCEVEDIITLKEKSRLVDLFKENFKNANLNTLPYIERDEGNFSATKKLLTLWDSNFLFILRLLLHMFYRDIITAFFFNKSVIYILDYFFINLYSIPATIKGIISIRYILP